MEKDKALSLRDLQEERNNLSALLEHKGYKWLHSLATSHMEARFMMLLKPATKVDECLQTEYIKGELNGIKLFRDIITSRLADINEQLEEYDENSSDDVQAT